MGDEWQETTLGAISAQEGYGLVDGPFGSNLPASSYTTDGVPVIRGSNLSLGTSRFRADEFVFVSEETARRLERSICRPGDIIVTKKGTLGQTGLVPSDAPYDRYLLSSNQMKLSVNPAIADPLFVYYFVSSPTSVEKIIRDSEATGVPKTNVAYLRTVPILLPSLSEQRGISHILGTLDDKIELNRRMNETLEAMARALFKSWFVDFDPVRAKAEGRDLGLPQAVVRLFPDALEDSELGEIPEGWRVGALDDIASTTMGLSPSGESYNVEGSGVPLINGPVEFGDYFPVKSKWTTSPTRMSEAGDLILCVRGSTTGRRVVADGPYCLGRGVCALRPRNISRTFLYHMIDTELARLLSKTTGSVFPNLSAPDIKQFPVVVPPPEITEAFGRPSEPLTVRAEAAVLESSTLAALRDALLPKLISGELRVQHAAKLVEAAA